MKVGGREDTVIKNPGMARNPFWMGRRKRGKGKDSESEWFSIWSKNESGMEGS